MEVSSIRTMVKTFGIVIFVTSALTACGQKNIKKVNDYKQTIINGVKENRVFIAREDSMQGSTRSYRVFCNENVFDIGRGEYVSCDMERDVNLVGVGIGKPSLLIPDFFVEDPSSYKLIVNSKHPRHQYYVISPTKLSPMSQISMNEWTGYLADNYTKNTSIKLSDEVYRNTAILNPYADLYRGKQNIPLHMSTSFENTFQKDSGRVVVYYSDDRHVYPVGIWTKKGLIGSLTHETYMEFDTNEELTIYTVFHDQVAEITVNPKMGETTYVRVDVSVNLGLRHHSRTFVVDPSSEQFDLVRYSSTKVALRKSLPDSFKEIEAKGVSILNKLINRP